MQTQNDLFIKMTLDLWNVYISRTNKLVDALTDEQLQNEVSPGRNSGVYLVGHLAAVHDAMLPLLGFGEKLFPEWENIFIKNPDKSGIEKPSITLIRENWKQVNEKLYSHFLKMNSEDWFKKHSAVSEEDFKKEPHRNKLNLVLNRTNHLSGHYGQMVFLNSKEE
ncbi:MAG TPA: DinB family protein [Chryseolinea sp.]|nr:DinB family protein [Chryseolinea sp.]HPH45939.1 DinB family protein [Chryseolinea sp.]HPM32114.1 DinB family protein [Chryseolinea sp.]